MLWMEGIIALFLPHRSPMFGISTSTSPWSSSLSGTVFTTRRSGPNSPFVPLGGRGHMLVTWPSASKRNNSNISPHPWRRPRPHLCSVNWLTDYSSNLVIILVCLLYLFLAFELWPHNQCVVLWTKKFAKIMKPVHVPVPGVIENAHITHWGVHGGKRGCGLHISSWREESSPRLLSSPAPPYTMHTRWKPRDTRRRPNYIEEGNKISKLYYQHDSVHS